MPGHLKTSQGPQIHPRPQRVNHYGHKQDIYRNKGKQELNRKGEVVIKGKKKENTLQNKSPQQGYRDRDRYCILPFVKKFTIWLEDGIILTIVVFTHTDFTGKLLIREYV